MRVRRVALVAVALALVALVNAGVVGVAALVGERSAGAVETRVGAATLSAGVSTHYPCGDPIWLKARLKDGVGQRREGRQGHVLVQAQVGRRAPAGDHRLPERSARQDHTAPRYCSQGVRANVRAKTVYRGVTPTAATWFTPKYT